MNKKAKIATIAILVLIGILLIGIVIAAKGGGGKGRKACNDNVDNDGDNYIDWPDDPGCANKQDNSELNPNIECDDGSDNDGDNTIDYPDDVGCNSPTDNDETNCGDSVCEGGEVCDVCVADCGYCDSCSDTDGGLVYTIQGTVSGYSGGSPYNNTDYCISSSLLREYYCSGDSPYSYDYTCPVNMSQTCINGACA
jgi:hypothetical protein